MGTTFRAINKGLELCPHPPRGPPAGQTLRGLKFIICVFIFLRSVPKAQSAHERDLELVSGADLWCNLSSFSSRGRSQGSRGPTWAPRGRRQKSGVGFIILSSLRSAQGPPAIEVGGGGGRFFNRSFSGTTYASSNNEENNNAKRGGRFKGLKR